MAQFFDPQAIPRSLDAIYNAYTAQQNRDRDLQRQRVSDTLNFGFDPSQATPDIITQAQGPETMVENPLVSRIREYMATKKKAQGLDLRSQQAGIAKNEAQAGLYAAQAQAAGQKAAAPKSLVQESIDREFGKEYAKFVAGGGYADVQKQLAQLERTAATLESPEGAGATGPIVGRLPDAARAFTREGAQAISLREGVEEVVQRNLKAVLGGQFTEREGEKLVQRAYNPSLPPPENARRVRLLIKQINDAAQAKLEAGKYIEQNGTLRGFQGVLRTSVNDFLTDSDLSTAGGAGQTKQSGSAPPVPGAVQKTLKNGASGWFIREGNGWKKVG